MVYAHYQRTKNSRGLLSMKKITIKTKLVLVALLSVITAFCGAMTLAPTAYADGSIDLTGAKWMVDKVEFDGNPLVYGGASKVFKLDKDTDNVLIYEYYGEGDVKLEGAPSLPGEYYVTVKAPEGVTVTGEYEARKDFTIKKAILVNPSVTFTKRLDIVRGKWIVDPKPVKSNFYSDAVITGDLEAGVVGTYTIKLEFTLADENFEFDASQAQKQEYKHEITDNGKKFVITYNWTVEENVERSFKNLQNKTIVMDKNNTLPEGIVEGDLQVTMTSMEDFDFDKFNDTLKAEYSDKGAKFGAAYDIYFAQDKDKKLDIADGSKFLITVPFPERLNDYEKDNIKVMFVKEDGGVEFYSINDIFDQEWVETYMEDKEEKEKRYTVRSVSFETAELGTFVFIGLTQLPDPVGDWWQIALVASLVIVAVLAVVFFVMKSKKKPEAPQKTETEEDNKNE